MSDRIPTLADLCCAIAEGSVSASTDGFMYTVNALELRRYFTELRSLPTVSQPSAPLDNASEWSVSTRTSVA